MRTYVCAVYGFLKELYSENVHNIYTYTTMPGQIIPIVAHNRIIASITRVVNIL